MGARGARGSSALRWQKKNSIIIIVVIVVIVIIIILISLIGGKIREWEQLTIEAFEL